MARAWHRLAQDRERMERHETDTATGEEVRCAGAWAIRDCQKPRAAANR